MMSGREQSREERVLLNPSFCASLLWHAARGYFSVGRGGLPYELAFLVLPFVLHRQTREALPKSTSTSLAVWLESNPLARGRITARAQLLVVFTKEALLFGGLHRFIRIDEGLIHADESRKRMVNRSLRESSDEVRECARKAEFVGKWLARGGSPATVFVLMGIRP